MDRIIEVKVCGNHLSKDNKRAGVKGEANVTKLHITFDEGWRHYAKEITFFDAYGKNPTKVILCAQMFEGEDDYLVPIPAEPLAESGMMTFVIDGTLDNKIQRSLSDNLEVYDVPDTTGAKNAVEPTPDDLQQMQGEIEYIKGNVMRAIEAREAIEAMRATAETLPTGEKAFVNKSEADGVVTLHFGLPRGDKGNTGDSGVYIGYEEPTDPVIRVWICPDEKNTDGDAPAEHVLKIKDSSGNWVGIPTISGESSYDIAVRHGFEGTEEEWVGDEYLRYTLSETLGHIDEILPNITGGIPILEDEDIDNYEKHKAFTMSNGRAFFYERYTCFPFLPSSEESKGLYIIGDTIYGIGTCRDKHIVIPRYSDDGTLITHVGACAFGEPKKDYSFIESIVFPDTIQHLGAAIVTESCTNLRTIYLMNPDVEWMNTDEKGEATGEAVGPAFYFEESGKEIFYAGSREQWLDLNTAGEYPLYTIQESVEPPTISYAYYGHTPFEIGIIFCTLHKQLGISLDNETCGQMFERYIDSDDLAHIDWTPAGAYSREEIDIMIANHVNNMENPHGVTASQVGAYTSGEVDSKIDDAVSSLGASIGAHVNENNNPHNVTAEQLGAYTKEETLEQINSIANSAMGAVSQSLALHENLADNPHNVTAEQVGAYAKTEMDVALGMKADDFAFYQHRTDIQNPHNVTAEQVGSYTKEEIDEKIADHSHDIAKYDNSTVMVDNLPVVIEGEDENNPTVIMGNKIRMQKGKVTFSYTGNVSIVANVESDEGQIFIDGNIVDMTSQYNPQLEFVLNDYIENTITFSCTKPMTVKFETFAGETFEDGFMAGREIKHIRALERTVGDFDTALDELHAYAQGLISGGVSE